MEVDFLYAMTAKSSQLAFCPSFSISLKNAFSLPISCCQVTVQSCIRTKANSTAGKIQEKKDWPWTRFHLMLLEDLLLARSVSESCILTLPSGNSILAYLESSGATQWKTNYIMHTLPDTVLCSCG